VRGRAGGGEGKAGKSKLGRVEVDARSLSRRSEREIKLCCTSERCRLSPPFSSFILLVSPFLPQAKHSFPQAATPASPSSVPFRASMRYECEAR
jgi:hypothetical protein